MSNPNINKPLRHIQGLLVLVCLVFLVLATGVTQARYRAEKEAKIQFQAAAPAQIYLGTWSQAATETEGESVQETTAASSGTETFHPEGELTWEEAAGVRSMELAVANGSSEESFYAKDQQFRLQLIGSLGLGTEEAFPKIELQVPSEENPETYETFIAVASRITVGTPLYHSVGSGWIVRFQNADGEEPVWILKGGALSYKRLIIKVENMQTDSDVLLQPQVITSVILK